MMAGGCENGSRQREQQGKTVRGREGEIKSKDRE